MQQKCKQQLTQNNPYIYIPVYKTRTYYIKPEIYCKDS